MMVLKPPLQARGPLLNLYVPRAGDGCVLYLPGQNDPKSNTIRDTSGRRNNGTITGATWKRAASGLWYLDFDGSDDFVDCGRDSSLDFGTSDFSLEVWINTTEATNVGTILGKGSTKRFDTRTNANGTVVFNIDDDANEFQITSTATVNDGIWHHLAFTADRDGNGIIYKDAVNVKEGACSATASIDDTSKDLTIGIFSGDESTQPFDGRIALPRIYMLALTAAEVASHYNQERHLFGV